jgi:hypothetical protein
MREHRTTAADVGLEALSVFTSKRSSVLAVRDTPSLGANPDDRLPQRFAVCSDAHELRGFVGRYLRG